MNVETVKEVNKSYRKVLTEGIEGDEYTLNDFGYACDKLKIPFVVYEKTINPFTSKEEDKITENTSQFESYKDFRETMPSWSARNYDYERDCPTYFYHIKGIEDGLFEVKDSNSSCSYHWTFITTDKVVIVYSVMCFID